VSTSAAGSLTTESGLAAAWAGDEEIRVAKASAAVAVNERRALWVRREDNVVTGQ
jgi:hypothetical protein